MSDTESNPQANVKQSTIAYTIRKAKDEHSKDYWKDIGIVVYHADGLGHTIVLDAMPIGPEIICRQAKPKKV